MSIVLAFSGGLDTSFCVPYLRETYDMPVHTVTVNTGGFGAAEAEAIEARALELGADQHHTVDARADLYAEFLSYMIKGNVLRGGTYPLSVGAERVIQAREVAAIAQQIGAQAISHGSTGAGNDQVRFDSALHLLAGGLDILTPIRTLGLSRAESTAFLDERGFEIPADTTTYSINRGLWGTTVGGQETLSTYQPLPESAYPATTAPTDAPDEPRTLTIDFKDGLPGALDDEPMDGVALVETLNELGGAHGIGRDIHVGDTILGIKGRVGFEAPAPHILITAHRELEKVVLTKWQRYQKDHLADFYGMLLHEAQYFDPVMRDIEAFLDSSQSAVTGRVTVKLYKGSIRVQGCTSPYSMFDASTATYGEEHALWDGRDAEGFTRLAGLQARLAHDARNTAQTAADTASSQSATNGTHTPSHA